MEESRFIKAKIEFEANDQGYTPAPLFRKVFEVENLSKAVLSVCGVGYGYYYINGQKVTEDLFTAPVSNYDKLCWYNRYDVSHLLQKGKNVICIILGNGFFNENFPSHWHNSESVWRDNPKFALRLEVDGETLIESDESFLCIEDSFVIHNQLRSGEIFDARKYDEDWKNVDFDDSSWHIAVIDTKHTPILKECRCEPIREMERYDFVNVIATEKGYVLDFGFNMSGYISAYIDEKEGTEITFSHSEEIYENGELKLNGLNILYPSVPFQVDKYICGKKNYRWSPKFTYHGFRYVLVEGLSKKPQKGDIQAVFVHQAVEKIAEFECSDEVLNKIYDAGIRATWSNMFYALTDCPTREKFGWTNDAQASAEQIYINFNCRSFFEKWIEDFKSCMTNFGALPAIVPTHGYGYYHGPVADGAFFEIPYQNYVYTGDKSMLIDCLPYFKKYYDFFVSDKNEDKAWLCDWDGYSNHNIDKNFIRNFYTVKLCKIILLAKQFAKENDTEFYEQEIQKATKELEKFIDKKGAATIEGQTAPAALLYWGLGNKERLVKQIVESIDEENGHLNCGMFGIQYLYDTLSQNGYAEYAYKIITAKGEPSVAAWIEKDGTTLWETWKDSGFTDSRNHHMYSNVLAWFFKYLLGIQTENGYQKIQLNPCFISELKYCKGAIETPYGKLSIEWKIENGQAAVAIDLPSGIDAVYQNQKLKAGKNCFEEKIEEVKL